MRQTFSHGSLGALAATALLASASGQDAPRYQETPAAFKDVPVQKMVLKRSKGHAEGGVADTSACTPQTSSHTNANFGGGSYIVQAGFAEQEQAACSYTIPAASFPIRLDLAEMIFATSNAVVQTTTRWSFTVWQGTPDTGTQIFTVSSDGEILPNLVMPPGTNGTNVQFMIDPGDPDQIYINDNGSHTFSIAYRIDHHNLQTQNPCFVAPPSNQNAFPTTDTDGLQQPANNWLWALNCGLSSCSGWKRFSQLPAGICRPSGDWVMRCTWTSLAACATGACCQESTCSMLSSADCATVGGTYMGDNVQCGTGVCSSTTPGACCFVATGGCISLTSANCVAAGGVPGPAGSSCSSYVCFPTGACCKPDGTCVGPVSPETCAALGGVYKGNNSTCGTVTCPPPMGAACFGNGFCLVLSQADAIAAGATWKGAGTTCADANGNGTADACEGNPADINHDGRVDGADLGILLGAWGTNNAAADLNHSGIVDGADLGILLGAWTV